VYKPQNTWQWQHILGAAFTNIALLLSWVTREQQVTLFSLNDREKGK